MLMRLRQLFGAGPPVEASERIYLAIVDRARQTPFYAHWGVPDTLDGRFEMIALHVFLVLQRLKSEPQAQELAQTLFDTLFADMDRNLREMGVGDLSVGRKVKAMAQALYGRIAAYEGGLGAGDDVLAAALRRNVYGSLRAAEDRPGDAVVAGLAGYVRRVAAALGAQPLDELVAKGPRFPTLDEDEGSIDRR